MPSHPGPLRVLVATAALAAILASPAAAQTKRVASSVMAGQPGEYRLGSGDKLRVQVFGEDSLGGEFSVSGSGRIALPLIGEVDALGLTASELQSRITAALKDGYLKDPRVGVEVLTYRPFYILGEVGKPGEYPYSNGLTVLDAVARAEGFTYRANTRRVIIKHLGEIGVHEEVMTTDTPVAPGDTIRIKERFF